MFNDKRIRTNCISTVLTFEGQFLHYVLTYPVNEDFMNTYGSENIIARTKNSKPNPNKLSKIYKLYFYYFTSTDFKELKMKLVQLQLKASALRLINETNKNLLIFNKLQYLNSIK